MTDDPVKNYFAVAVSAPVNRPLTYLAPDTCDQPLMPGMRVLVPLSGRKITGYILERVGSAPQGQQIKKIYEVLGSEPLFPAEQVSFYKWIAKYYHYPIG
ncbi:MAG: primosomal protein N', partial [Desulfobulbaceae bacterium]|nr:primosomal protein N' [Desulfobulbaceae bacterium]